MNKKFFWPIIVFIILIVVFGFYLSKEMKDFEWSGGAVIEPGKNYVIKEINGETIVENKNVGLTFKVPVGWDVEKMEVGLDEWVISMTSPDIVVSDSGILEDGCGVSVEVIIGINYANAVRVVMSDAESSDIDGYEYYEFVEVSGYRGVKFVHDTSSGAVIGVQVPVADRIYNIESFTPDNNDCSWEFGSIMNSFDISS